MGRPSRSERMASKGRPKRRAARTHFFKYQLANNPTRAEESDLKRALEESLKEQSAIKIKGNNSNIINLISSTNSSDFTKSSNNTSYSNQSAGSDLSAPTNKRTRSSSSNNANHSTSSKRTNCSSSSSSSNGDNKRKSDVSETNPLKLDIPTSVPHINKAIKTYSRSQSSISTLSQKSPTLDGPRSSTPIRRAENTNVNTVARASKCSSNMSKSTQTPSASNQTTTTTSGTINNSIQKSKNNTIAIVPDKTSTPVQDQAFKFKRESKNYAYVKMTALKVSNSKSSSAKKTLSNGVHTDSTKKTTGKDTSARNNANLCHANNGYSGLIKQVSREDGSIDHSSKRENIKTSITEQQNITLGKKSTDAATLTKTSPHYGKATDMNSLITKVANKNVQVSRTGTTNNLKQDSTIHISCQSPTNDCSITDDVTIDLSMKKNQNQANVKVTKKRIPQGSWSLLGVPEEKVIYLRDEEHPRRLICYPAIKHIEGDVIQVRDSVLLRSGARKTDLPYIAKVCAFWEDAETGNVMMSLFWYYRPEHTEEGRKAHHLSDEIFASRHRDVDSVECIEDKCYVLTFNEYCRYRKRCKMEQVNITWSLTDVTIPVSNESYPRRNRIPDSDVNPELVFCCRQIYDSRMKRLVKNPLINPKYGHI